MKTSELKIMPGGGCGEGRAFSSRSAAAAAVLNCAAARPDATRAASSSEIDGVADSERALRLDRTISADLVVELLHQQTQDRRVLDGAVGIDGRHHAALDPMIEAQAGRVRALAELEHGAEPAFLADAVGGNDDVGAEPAQVERSAETRRDLAAGPGGDDRN